MRKVLIFIIFAVLIPAISNFLPAVLKPLRGTHGRFPSKAIVIWTALSGMTTALAQLFIQELKHSFR